MEAILSLAVPVSFLLLLVLEKVFPARALPKVRGWHLKGGIYFVLGGVVSAALPAAYSTLLGPGPLDASGLGMIGAALVSFVLSDLVVYFVHRLVHTVPLLWRWTHQMHHSAERMDVAGSAIFHPFDSVVLGGAAVLPVWLLGLPPEAAALNGLLGFLAGTFQHMNVRTPRWVGFLIQRPEAHAVHHARGVHAYNYGCIPLWDMLFGTFRNPEAFTSPSGFWDGASGRLGAMLLGRDIGEERRP
jgi:sterol desaturase/sphingolipid hydroxylase (fatty acid hydroxylase superfamily)